MRKTTRRRLLTAAGTGLAGALAGCATVIEGATGSGTTTDSTPEQTTTRNGTKTTTETTTGTETTETTTEPLDVDIQAPDVFDDEVPTPDEPSEYRYAVMGDPEDAPTAAVFGNWKCPYTREFVREQLPGLVEEYVRPGSVAVEFRAVAYQDDEPFLGPDAPRAARAGLAAWNVDPESYWRYFAYVFGNQPPESRAWAQPDLLARFATRADVNPRPQFRAAVDGSAYRDAVRATSARFREFDGQSVPRVVTRTGVTAPTVDAEATRRQFERLAGDDGDD